MNLDTWIRIHTVLATTQRHIRNLFAAEVYHAKTWLKDEIWNLKWHFNEWKQRRAAIKAAKAQGFVLPTVKHDAPIPAGDNPFCHDSFSMGTTLVRGWMIMHPGYDNKECPLDMTYAILVNTRTGQRIRIDLRPCYGEKS